MFLSIKNMAQMLFAFFLISLWMNALADWTCPILKGDHAVADVQDEMNQLAKTHWMTNKYCVEVNKADNEQVENNNLKAAKTSICFGQTVQVQYNHTIGNLLDESSQFKVLENFPGCWHSLAPLLCAIKFRPTEFETGCSKADLVVKLYRFRQIWPKSICFGIKNVCADLMSKYVWLDRLLNCEDDSLFSDKCQKTYNTTKNFTFTSECISPLVKVNLLNVSNSAFTVDVCHLGCDSAFVNNQEGLAIFRHFALATVLLMLTLLVFVLCYAVKTKQHLTTILATTCLCAYFSIWFVSLFINMVGQATATCKLFDGVSIRINNNGLFTSCSVQSFLLSFCKLNVYTMLIAGIAFKGYQYKKKLTFYKRLTFETIRLVFIMLIEMIIVGISFWSIPTNTDGLLNICTSSFDNSYFVECGFVMISILIIGVYLMDFPKSSEKASSTEPPLLETVQTTTTVISSGIKLISKKHLKFLAIGLIVVVQLLNGLIHYVFGFTPDFENQKLNEKIKCLIEVSRIGLTQQSCQLPIIGLFGYIQLFCMMFVFPFVVCSLSLAVLWNIHKSQKSCKYTNKNDIELKNVGVQNTEMEENNPAQTENLSLLDGGQNNAENWINDHFDVASSVPESARQINSRQQLWFDNPIYQDVLLSMINGQSNSQPMPPFPADGSNNNAWTQASQTLSSQTEQIRHLANGEQNSALSPPESVAVSSSAATDSDAPTSTSFSDPRHMAKNYCSMGLAYIFSRYRRLDPVSFLDKFYGIFQDAFRTFLRENYPEFLGGFSHFDAHIASNIFVRKGQLQSDQLTRFVADLIRTIPLDDVPVAGDDAFY